VSCARRDADFAEVGFVGDDELELEVGGGVDELLDHVWMSDAAFRERRHGLPPSRVRGVELASLGESEARSRGSLEKNGGGGFDGDVMAGAF
jgi:hypothetical protein